MVSDGGGWAAVGKCEMRIYSRWVLCFLCAMLAVGCAARAFTPATLDCHALRMTPVTNVDERLEFSTQGFSILPPQGENWCIQSVEPRGVVFGKHLLSGKLLEKQPRLADVNHTFAALAMAFDAKTKIESSAELKAFVDQMLRGGALGALVEGTEGSARRFRLVESNLVLDNYVGSECVRFDAIVEERDNPRRPGSVLMLNFPNNLLCRHPYSPGVGLIWISFNERYLQGEQPLAGTMKHEFEPSLRSLQFMPPR